MQFNSRMSQGANAKRVCDGCRSHAECQWVFVMVLTDETTTAPLVERCGLSSFTLPGFAPHVAPCTHAVSHGRQYRNSRALASCTTHSSPSFRFMPVIALQLMTCHWCVLMASSRRPCAPVSILLARQQLPPSRSTVTYLAHFVLSHCPGDIALVLEDKQACSR